MKSDFCFKLKAINGFCIYCELIPDFTMYMQFLLIILSMQTSFVVYGNISTDTEVPLPNPLEEAELVQENVLRQISVMFLMPRANNLDCDSNSSSDFPNFFTDEQRKDGAIVIPFLVGIYCFTLLALICDNYFLPCVGKICEFLNLSQDVAAATFMAMATSAPELFVNVIGTFVTESDLGIGTIVGSSMFNTLGVAALGGLAAKAPIQLDWWPVSRDCFLYLVSIVLLVVMSWDGKVFWYEGMILFIVYFIYFTIMFNNSKVSKFCKRIIKKLQMKLNSSADAFNDKFRFVRDNSTSINQTPALYLVEEHAKRFTQFSIISDINSKDASLYSVEKTSDEKKTENEAINVYIEIDPTKVISSDEGSENISTAKKLFKKFMYIYTCPLKLFLFCFVPDPMKKPKLFPLTFILCVLIIGANSYVISWMITIIGNTFGISDTVLGLTFLAAGGCLPEAVSITIMSRKGEGSMGISNALGANSMNILLSLGLPWFIKTLIMETRSDKFVEITSGAIEYTILSLVLVVIALFITLYCNGFKLQKRTGIILIVIYLIFLSCTLATELIMKSSETCE
ncbi:hypothetical protein PPYR_08581 [Photinus pyralis]|uniref:Sodium/calcium exchanger membrane region domain-containing protein n=1 Tax=Photinus pyralis TaxID=7054 RepID=A0A5N4AK42_PHOPY|nr:sodium/potassium/calcium exchanger 4-like isoform X2 [Photinus pyralis]KAB0797588.1 hypothetical protein PPYR_08581 [Photinus pyralis]